MAPGVIRHPRPLGGWPGAVAAMAAPGLPLAGCGAGTIPQPAAASLQQEAISWALVAADGRRIIVPFTGPSS